MNGPVDQTDASRSDSGAVPSLGAQATTELLTWPSVMEDLRAALATPQVFHTPPRMSVPAPGGELLVMPAVSDRWAGVKISAVGDGHHPALPRIQSTYTLLDAQTLTPRVHLDGTVLTLRRTAALSALVAGLTGARPGGRVVVVGTGPQAIAHAQAMSAAGLAGRVGVLGRDPDRSRACGRALAAQGISATVAAPHDLLDADLVVCCTSARTPVFDSSLLRVDCRVVAIGSHRPAERELDTALMDRAQVVVEDLDSARREAGDIVIAETELGRGLIDATAVQLLSGEWVADPLRCCVFKSVGAGWQDLAVAGGAAGRLDQLDQLDRLDRLDRLERLERLQRLER